MQDIYFWISDTAPPKWNIFTIKILRHSVWQHMESLEKPQHEIDSFTFKLAAQEVSSAHTLSLGSTMWKLCRRCFSQVWSNLLASRTTEQLPLQHGIQISLIRSMLLTWRGRVYDCQLPGGRSIYYGFTFGQLWCRLSLFIVNGLDHRDGRCLELCR